MKLVMAFSATLAILLAAPGYAPTHPPAASALSVEMPAHPSGRPASLLGAPRRMSIRPYTSRHVSEGTRLATSGDAFGNRGGLDSQRTDASVPSKTATPTRTSQRGANTPSPSRTATPASHSVLAAPTATARRTQPRAKPSATATRTPMPQPTKRAPVHATHRPYSWMAQTTLLTIYGRAFSTAPILGRLGMDDNFTQLEWQVQPYARGIKANNGGTDPRITVHLIYAMAVPCGVTGNCLYYLDDAGVDIVKTYITEAARRHWLVILDDQLGRSDPATEMQRIISKGYLKYDNVEVALDPEFRTAAYQSTPGIPVGTVSAAELNAAGAMLNAYAARLGLLHRKIMMVHQFREDMITARQTLRQDLFYVDTVIVADGFGPPGLKAHIYDELLGPGVSDAIHWRGIKLFPFNQYEGAGHGDFPEMTWPQVFGRAPALDGGTGFIVQPIPNVVVIA